MEHKPYAEMTEEERKAWFGYAFKRLHPMDVPEAYVCTCDPNQFGSGYGVVAKEYDPWGMYDIEELKQYLEDYPEMNCIGWIKPYTDEQKEIIDIRTSWVNFNDSQLKSKLYTNQKYKFKNDDMWEGNDKTQPLLTFDDSTYTSDEATVLITQYTGDDDVKATALTTLRNEAKNYIRTVADKFLAEHAGKPEDPQFPREYYND